jgi:hypothetical protein
MSVASTSAMKQSVSVGTGAGHCLHQKYERNGSGTSDHIQTGSGIWMRFS